METEEGIWIFEIKKIIWDYKMKKIKISMIILWSYTCKLILVEQKDMHKVYNF